MNDREQILELIAHYAELVNDGRDGELHACFAPGAVFDGLGTFDIDSEFDRYLAFLAELRSTSMPGMRQFLGASSIEVNGDCATARTQVMLLATPQGEHSRIVRAGQMEDRLVRHGGSWRFLRRTARVDGLP